MFVIVINSTRACCETNHALSSCTQGSLSEVSEVMNLRPLELGGVELGKKSVKLWMTLRTQDIKTQ